MTDKTKNYNLVDEDWIPVLWNNGEYSRVGIRTALTKAGKIRQIAASNPMDRFAILRFLLAVLYWCKGNPPYAEKSKLRSGFPVEWFNKLDSERECFNLLGDCRRFYQSSDAHNKRPVTDLIQEIPTGHNAIHFRHSIDSVVGLCPACCAMGLLRLPLFSVSGLPDLKAGINGTPPIYATNLGNNLLASFQANWTYAVELGRPTWTHGFNEKLKKRVPMLTGLTMVSRRVWLHDPSPTSGCCNLCGEKNKALIKTCEYKTAGSQQNETWSDPNVVYQTTKPTKSLKAQDLTKSGVFRMDKPWPEFISELFLSDKFINEEESTNLHIVGFATDKAKNVDVWERTIIVNPTKDACSDISDLAKTWRNEGRSIERQMASKYTGSKEHLAAARPNIEHRVSENLDHMIAEDKEFFQEAAKQYTPMMKILAKSLSPGASLSAAFKRQQILRTTPRVTPKKASVDKSKTEKGGK